MNTYKRCIMIMADGARPDVVEKLLEEGRLPEIERYLIEPGGFHQGVTAFPSTTGPAYLPFLTGCYPGTCNVPGIRWFDKDIYAKKPWSRAKHRSYVGADTLKMNHDIDRSIKTIFNLIPRSVNIFSGVNRGVSFRFNKTSFMRIWNWYYAHLTDHWSLPDENASRMLMDCIEEDPDFVFVVFPGIDEFAHMGGPFHAASLAGYERIDETVGQLVRKLERKNWLDETIIMIVSDHGLTETKEHLGLDQFLENNGVKTFYYPVIFQWGFSVAHMVSGNGMSHLYFPQSTNGRRIARRDWLGVCYEENMNSRHWEILGLIDEQDAVDFMAIRSKDGGVIVRRGSEKARVYHDGDKICYERISGDPLRYYGLPGRLTEEEWLSSTYDTDYPDALVQLLQLIRSPRTGDVILSARPGFDLRKCYEIPEHHGSHGSLHREHMQVPIMSNVPLKGPVIRSVDIFATVCECLGESIPVGIDGISRA